MPRFPHRLLALGLLLGGVLTLLAASTAVAQGGASGSITITLNNPYPDAVVGDEVEVRASVTSTFEIVSVRADLGPRSVALTYNAPNWTGTLHTEGLPRGPYPFEIVATDRYGATGTRSFEVIVDRTPVLTALSPVSESVVSTSPLVEVACTDDGGPCEITVSVSGHSQIPPLVGTGTVSGTLDLSTVNNRAVWINVRASDGVNPSTHVGSSRVYVEDVGPWITQDLAPPGTELLDADAGRLLYRSLRWPYGTRTIAGYHVMDRQTGAVDTVTVNLGLLLEEDRYVLLGDGVFIQPRYRPDGTGRAYFWDETGLMPLGGVHHEISTIAARVEVAYPHAFWQGQVDIFSPITNQLFDVRTRTTTELPFRARLGLNGDYYDAFTHRYRDGVRTFLFSGAMNNRYAFEGDRILYTRYFLGQSELRFYDGEEEQRLATFPPYDAQIAFAGDVLAFTSPSHNGQVLRGPLDGPHEQLTFFTTPITLEGIDPSGGVMVRAPAGRYYFNAAGQPFPLGASEGKAFWRDGVWRRLMGRHLAELDPTVVTAVDAGPGLPAAAALSPVAPNPARGRAAVSVTLERAGPVRLVVHDVLGRQVAIVEEAVLAAGTHAVGWDVGRFAPGTYVLTLEAGGRRTAQTFTVAR